MKAMRSSDFKGSFNDWVDVRWNTTELVKGMTGRTLKTKLPRPGLDTFCKHFQEMIDVQTIYTDALKNGTIDFNQMGGNDDYTGEESATSLLSRMKKADAALKKALSITPENARIKWPGLGAKIVHSHVANLCAHEMFHFGQLVAFCYVTGVSLPKSLIDAWSLSPQRKK
jgi:uncharacterized damage-inducible protein DinB